MTPEESAYAQKIAATLTEAKDKAGLSFDDLAKMTGLSRAHVTRIMYGLIDARVADLRRICKVLEIDAKTLLDD
jgi:cyanate lyase